MTSTEQKQAFQDDLARLVNRYAVEFDMTWGDIATILEMEKFFLMCKIHKIKTDGK